MSLILQDFEPFIEQGFAAVINWANHSFVVFDFEHLVSGPHSRKLESFTLFDAGNDVHLLPAEFELSFILGQIFLYALFKNEF